MRPLAARCHLGVALASVELEGTKVGSQSFNEARESFRLMGMNHWFEQADRMFDVRI